MKNQLNFFRMIMWTFVFLFSMQSFSLLSQNNCETGPSPQIITDVINTCQEPKGDHVKPSECIHVCENTPIEYEGIVNANSILSWQVFGGTLASPSTVNPITVVWGESGSGSVVLTETDSNGCTATTQLCIEIDEGPSVDYAAIPEIINNSITICEGGEVFFEDHSSEDVVAWEWDFGDGNVSNLENPSNIFINSGNYVVSLTVYNDCGCSQVKEIQVNVESGWTPIIECISTTCEKLEATYSVTNYCEGATFNWTIINGTILDPTTNPVQVTWNTAAEGYLGVSVQGCDDLCPITSYVNVPIIGQGLNISGPNVVCVGDYVQYSVPNQPGSIFKWTSSCSNGVLSENSTVDIDWATVGQCTIYVSIISPGLICPQADEEITYVVDILPKFDFTIENNICQGNTVSYSFVGTVPNNYTFHAQDANGIIIDLSIDVNGNLETNNLPVGTYQIFATTTDAFCNEPIQILNILPAANTPIIQNVTGEFQVCPNSVHEYNYNLPTNMVPTWTAIGGVIQGNDSNESVVVQWGSSPPYELQLTQIDINNLDCPSSPLLINISEFMISPVDIVTSSTLGLTEFCASGFETFTALQTENVSDYTWSIIPNTAGSIITGNHTQSIDVEFHDFNGPATISVVARICETEVVTNYDININSYTVEIVAPPTQVCQGETINFSTSSSPLPPGTTSNITWDLNGVTTNSDITFNTVGTSTVTVTETLSGGSCDGVILTDVVTLVVLPNPITYISAPNGTNLCNQTPLQLVASVQVDVSNPTSPYDYVWSTGDVSQTTTVSSPGVYSVTVTSSATGCSTTKSITIVHNCDPNPPCSFNTTVSLDCEILTVSGDPNIIWSFGDQSPSVVGSTTHSYNYSGVFYVQAQLGSCVKTIQVIVDFIPRFVANFTCDGNGNIITHLIDQTDSYVPQSSLTYNWILPSGANIVGGSLTSTFVDVDFSGANLPQDVTISVTGANGTCEFIATVESPSPIVADFSVISPRCINADVHFSTNYSSDVVTEWNFGDGAFSTNQNPVRAFDTDGNHNVTLMVTDEYGCTSSIIETVEILASPYSSGLEVTPTPSILCEGESVDLFSNPLSSYVPVTYSWTQNISSQLSNNSPNLLGANTTSTYQLFVQDNIGCEDKFSSAQVIVTAPPLAVIRGQDYYCQGDNITLNAYAGENMTYQWFLNGTPITTPSIPYIIELLANSYVNNDVYTVIVSDSNCNKVSDPFTIKVLQGPNISVSSSYECVPATFTVSVSGSIPVSQYVWSNGENGNSSTYYSGGTGTVVGYSPEGCSTTKSFNIVEGPDVSDIAVGCYCFDENSVEWQLAPIGNYLYTIEGNGSTVTTTSSTYTFTQSGVYTVTVTDQFTGCSTTTAEIILDLKNCRECKFYGDIKDVKCLGYDVFANGFIYEYIINFHNDGVGLNGLAGSSNEVQVDNGSISPNAIPGGTATVVTGTFVGMPGQTPCIIFTGSGSNGVTCQTEVCFHPLKACKDCKGCHLSLGKPKIECVNTNGELSHFTYSLEFYNKDCPLVDLFWFAEKDDFEISLDQNVIADNSTGYITGDIQLPYDVNGELTFTLVGINPFTGEKCEYKVDFRIPECKYEYDCEKVEILEEEVVFSHIDAYGNFVYSFDFVVESPISNGDAMVLPYDQLENEVNWLDVVSAGNTYYLSGLISDVPPFSEKICFYIAIFRDGKFCWTKFCVEVSMPAAKSKPETITGVSNLSDVNILSILPNPANDKIYVSFDLSSLDENAVVEMKIFNHLGQVVHNFDRLQSLEYFPIETKRDGNGIYNLVLFVDGQVVGYSKFIVQH